MQQQAAGGPRGPGSGEQSIPAAPHTSSPAAAPAVGSKPACACRRDVMQPIQLVRVGFLGVGSHFFFKEVFIF